MQPDPTELENASLWYLVGILVIVLLMQLEGTS